MELQKMKEPSKELKILKEPKIVLEPPRAPLWKT
jgi:hypothetical protein